MSNSTKKTPISGWTTSSSEAVDKKIWHSKFRSVTRDYLNRLLYQNDINYVVDYVGIEAHGNREYKDQCGPHIYDVSDVWGMNKDGRGWFGTSRNQFAYWFGGLWEDPLPESLFKAGQKVSRRGRIRYILVDKQMRK